MSLKKDLHQKDNKGSLRAPFFIYSNAEIDISIYNALGDYFRFKALEIEAKTEMQYLESAHKLNNNLIEPIW